MKISLDRAIFELAFENAQLGKSIALWRNSEQTDAISALDSIIERFTDSANPVSAKRVANVIGYKGGFLSKIGQSLNDDDVVLLLEMLAQSDLRVSPIGALIGYVRRVGPAVALKTIQESGAAEVLLPFVVALQQELGEKPRVPKEVEEVAKDIRERL